MKLILIGYYIFSFLLLGGLIKLFKMIDRPRYRDSDGNESNQAGYSEDPLGNVLDSESPEMNIEGGEEEPHVFVEGTETHGDIFGI